MLNSNMSLINKISVPLNKFDLYLTEVQKTLDRRFDIVDRLTDSLFSFAPTKIGEIIPTIAPYDVHLVDGTYRIDVALAGFSKEQIEVNIIGGTVLLISATSDYDLPQQRDNVELGKAQALHKKLSYANKELRFNISKNSEVHDVSFKDGLLTIFVTPPAKKPEADKEKRSIEIK